MGTRPYSVFIGSGSSIPSRVVANEDFLTREFFTEDGEPFDPTGNETVIRKFEDITEIGERRYAEADQVTSDLATEAAEAAIEDADIDPESLDYVVVAHNFGDVGAHDLRLDTVPTLAARVKERLRIRNTSCVAYDLPFGCPGWLQAVIQADYFLRSGDAHRALVIGSETLSRVIDPHDRDSMIYADGAGAVVMEATQAEEPVGILSHVTRSDTLEEARFLHMGPSYNARSADDRIFIKMHGRRVYEYAVRHVPEVVRCSLERAGLRLTDVAKVLVHQANAKMDQAILKRLFRLYGECDIPEEIMPMTVSWLGNSSVATLPTLLDLMRRRRLDGHRVEAGDIVVFASVGAGMNINSVVYRQA